MNEPMRFLLIGNPVSQSLSPLMHNAAYAEMGLAAVYEACYVSDLAAAVADVRGKKINGVSVTIPFKTDIMKFLDEVDSRASAIGAVNTVHNNSGRLIGYNTDCSGFLRDLKEAMEIKGRSFVVLGAGGTARAAVFGIMQEGGEVVVVGRNEGRVSSLAFEFGCRHHPLSRISTLQADCLINTTPVGMYPHTEESPVDREVPANYHLVVDVIYNPLRTKLLRDAGAAGKEARSGVGMFVNQGADQIKIWTGIEPPRTLMKQTVTGELEKKYGNQTRQTH